MGVSAAIFESAGQRTEHYIPGTYSRSNNVSSPSGISAGNLVILGKSTGGKPQSLLSFSNLAEAKDVLLGGDLLSAIGYAFNGSNVYVPQRVHAMRVNPGTQAMLSLDGIQIFSKDYGTHCNQLKLMLSTNNDSSRQLSVGYKDDIINIDNIIRESFEITYSGEGTAHITIDTQGITLKETIQSEESDPIINELKILYADYSTIEDVVRRINDTDIYAATVKDIRYEVASNELDYLSEVELSGEPYTCYSNNQAIVDALKTITYFAEPSLSSRSPIPDTDGYVYFTGGTIGDYTIAEFLNALELLEVEDVQIIATPETDLNIQMAILSHCITMSSTTNRKERTCFLGGGIGEEDSEALSKAKGFNSKYCSYITDSGVCANPITGVTENVTGAMIGVMLAGMESGMAVCEPLTFKPLRLLGITKRRTNTSMEKLIKGGVLVVNPNPENPSEIVVIRAMTTNQGNDDLISCERSMTREDLFMNRDLRNRFNSSIGKTNNYSVSAIKTILEYAAKEWNKLGYIIPEGGKNVWNIGVRISGDKVYLTYSRNLTAPRNFVFITATNQIFETTVEL